MSEASLGSVVILAQGGGLFLLPVGLCAFAFWIWMIADCIRHESEGSTKIAWLLAIVLAGMVGAPLYFFLRKVPRGRSGHFEITRPVYQPWRKDRTLG